MESVPISSCPRSDPRSDQCSREIDLNNISCIVWGNINVIRRPCRTQKFHLRRSYIVIMAIECHGYPFYFRSYGCSLLKAGCDEGNRTS
jgi:hypothetical protein